MSELIGPIEQDGLPGTLEPTGYHLPPDLSYADWETTGYKLAQQLDVQANRLDMLRWWVGDWLLYGEHTYGQKYAQAVEILGNRWAVGTLQGWMWVSHQYATFARANYALPWSHFRQVAALTPRQRAPLLQAALQNNWSRRQLKDALETKYPPEPQIQPVQPEPPVEPIQRGVAYSQAHVGEIWTVEHHERLAAFLLVPGPDDGAQDDQ